MDKNYLPILFLLILLISSCSPLTDLSPNKDGPVEFQQRNWKNVGCESGDFDNPGIYCLVGQMYQVDADCVHSDECGGSTPYCEEAGKTNEYSCVECLTTSHCAGVSTCNSEGECVSGGGGGVPCPPDICQIETSPPMYFPLYSNVRGNFIHFRNNLNFYKFNLEKRKNIIDLPKPIPPNSQLRKLDFKLETPSSNREVSRRCEWDGICASCSDLTDNDYGGYMDVNSPGCDYWQLDPNYSPTRGDSSEGRNDDGRSRSYSRCMKQFNDNAASFLYVSEGSGLCEDEATYSEACGGSGLGYVTLTNSYHGWDGLSLCDDAGISCCVKMSQQVYSSDGLIPASDNDWDIDIDYNRYCGDNYCQGWNDVNGGVCRGPDHGSGPSEKCVIDSGWSMDYVETYDSCGFVNSEGVVTSDCMECIDEETGVYDCSPIDTTIYYDCIIDDWSCPDIFQEVSGLYLSNPTNGHISTSSNEYYHHKLCCNPDQFTVSPSSGHNFISLTSSDNAHAGQVGNSGYTDYKINVPGGCTLEYAPDSTGCSDENKFCVLSLSATDNAHIGSCLQQTYPYKVCCY